ncbi:hypothetical protein ABT024_04940 [Streptomyces sp. NPDC002812]|uniref:hypothetical protein n=1 Tax=Streptomyces sp. NPDC002812 TaxID=3154434 RepID=UPI00332F9734
MSSREQELPFVPAELNRDVIGAEAVGVRGRISDPTPLPRYRDAAGEDVDFPPVDNGLDYLVSVVDGLERDEYGERPGPRKLKYAVLHLQAAAEVLLKARLEIEHWTLVTENITNKKVSREKFEKGEFTSITPEEAVRRIREIVGEEISKEEAAGLDKLTKRRNALQHYRLTTTYEEIESLTAEVLVFLMRFLHESLLPRLTPAEHDRIKDDLTYVTGGTIRIQRYVTERMEQIRPALKGKDECIVQCPRCAQDAVLVTGNGGHRAAEAAKCLFCRTTWTADALATDYVLYHLAGFFQDDVPPCPTCHRNRPVVRYVVRGTEMNAPRDSDRSPYDSVTFCFACARPAAEAPAAPAHPA